MIVLQEVGTNQTFKITPRSGTATTMTLQKEGTTIAPVSYNITLAGTGYYRTITKTVTLDEGCSYELIVYNNSDVIYKGRVYCTNQTIEDYTINDDLYAEHGGTYLLY